MSARPPRPLLRLLLGAGLGAGCGKVPLLDIEAGFSRADAAWFAEEDTLFVFYELTAQQGLSTHSVLEISYVTDTERVGWTALSALPQVHTHLDVDCGPTALCGSTSIPLADEPRDVRLRLRYHEEGSLALDAETVFNVVGPGAPHSHRSYLVYGVFDATNTQVQWRGRHQFPTLRNEEASALGLRRALTVAAPSLGGAPGVPVDNPYLYGIPCSGNRRALDWAPVSTDERAVFHPAQTPADGAVAPELCAEATVTDARGTHTTAAHARRNPEVQPAFPVLRSPVEEARQLRFYLAPCGGPIDADHDEMQRERMGFGSGVPKICIDDWDDPDFVPDLAATFREAVEAARPDGDDMVLSIVLQREEDGAADALEEALALVAPDERHRSSPRLAGAFVFDSDVRDLALEESVPVLLWCPTAFPTDRADVPSSAALTCAIAPDDTDFELGPLSFGALPVLPSRARYLDFIDTYSRRQAGEVTDRAFLAPRFATTSDHVDLGRFGVVTFLNGEQVSARGSDAFSYCKPRRVPPVAFRTAFMRTEEFAELVDQACDDGQLSEQYCETLRLGVLPLEQLPALHNSAPFPDYELGLAWDFPFLLRMTYEAFAAGSVSALGLSIPFGVAQNGEQYLGTRSWLAEETDLREVLTQCHRFCDHPTFDGAGVYRVRADFRTTYETGCYTPRIARPGDGGFPLDP